MKETSADVNLLDLPQATLTRIARHALSIGSDGTLRPDKLAQRTAVSLSRTCRGLRNATALSIQSLNFADEAGLWPSVSALSPMAWPGLHTLKCTVNRANLSGFLKWLTLGTDISCLSLRVVGEPYPQSRLAQLERMLLGRMFTQMGSNLVELEVAGIDSQTVLFTTLFQCTKLRKIAVGLYGDSGTPATLLNMMVLLCLVNRDHLQVVQLPFDNCNSGLEGMPNGGQLCTSCKVTWETLLGSYKAGLKESAVNLPSNEDELVASFKKMSSRMDSLEAAMLKTFDDFSVLAPSVKGSDVLHKILFGLLPRVEKVNTSCRESIQ